MAGPTLASIPWFHEFMRLPNSGLTPTVSPAEYLPSRDDLARFFGPKHDSGFTFEDRGNAEYNLYVRELYMRVLQLPWPMNGVLQSHFARGLLAEAMGLDINWSEFGYKMTHPHEIQRFSNRPRVLDQFLDLRQPLPPLPKVLPSPEFQVSFFFRIVVI